MLLKVNAPLDPGFMPMSIVYRDFESAVKAEGGEKLTIALERNDGRATVNSFHALMKMKIRVVTIPGAATGSRIFIMA